MFNRSWICTAVLGWFGTAVSIVGAFLMSFGFILFGYIFFTLGSMAWLTIAIYRKDNSLLTLNGFFFVANIIGLTRAVF